jgi:UDP-N-acetyl-D-glucosamine dehydrogenase
MTMERSRSKWANTQNDNTASDTLATAVAAAEAPSYHVGRRRKKRKGEVVGYKGLMQRIKDRDAVVGIMGMGYVGLPLMKTFCKAGHNCIAYDVDDTKVTKLNNGRSYIKHIPSKDLKSLCKDKMYRATTNGRELRKCDIVVICVPTPLTKTREPDLSYVESTARTIAENLQKHQLIILESTTYPRTTREIVLPILESTGMKVGRDFYLAYSPEREDPGREDYSTATIPKVVGGMDPKSGAAAAALYKNAISEVVEVGSCETAEACKILENVYRSVNIALVNELKVLFDKMDIDVWEVIRAASTKPFGFQAFYPGPGLGGHCIPIDPFYLTWKAREYDQVTRFIELAGEINTAMPSFVISKVAEALNRFKKPIRGSKILVLGIAYKKDVDDMRESPALALIEMLKERGAKVDYNDPHVSKIPKLRDHDLRMTSKNLTVATMKSYDCVLIATAHSAYDPAWIVRNSKLVVDTRNLTGGVKAGRSKIVKA